MRAKLCGVAILAFACALLFTVGATSQPPGVPRLPTPPPGYGGPAMTPPPVSPDGDLGVFDIPQLMAELSRVRQERAALARRERAILDLLPKKIAAQRKELNDAEKQLRDFQGGKERKGEEKR
jgi:hypothetical protein